MIFLGNNLFLACMLLKATSLFACMHGKGLMQDGVQALCYLAPA